MSRGEYDRTYDVYYGATSTAGTPGTLYLAGQPCRVVFQDRIQQLEFPNSLSAFWMTYAGPSFNMSNQVNLVAQVYSFDFGSADVLAIPSGNVPTWTVLRSEKVTPMSGLPYYRVLIVPTAEIPTPIPPPPPPPPPPVPGGFACSTAVPFTFGSEFFAQTQPVLGASSWYHSAIVTGSYFVDVVLPSGATWDFFVVFGASCSSLVTAVHVSVSGTYSFAVTSGTNVWVHCSSTPDGQPFQFTIRT